MRTTILGTYVRKCSTVPIAKLLHLKQTAQFFVCLGGNTAVVCLINSFYIQ